MNVVRLWATAQPTHFYLVLCSVLSSSLFCCFRHVYAVHLHFIFDEFIWCCLFGCYIRSNGKLTTECHFNILLGQKVKLAHTKKNLIFGTLCSDWKEKIQSRLAYTELSALLPILSMHLKIRRCNGSGVAIFVGKCRQYSLYAPVTLSTQWKE